ncbi:hypothetical protein [Nitrosomonas sp. sh817]|uniref:hypothetical protein n=1 Tax=Nitrosomonas sp. sh817 TaxID=3070658 RepID=UPI0027DBE1F1|nr:hypothetical protein [Nitrosomonas sp. sh817]WMJ08680.1 hypothetical protein RBH92_00280 [Nitrosomonas sp. sh817]
MKLRLITLLAASAFLSACSTIPEATQSQSNIKVGKSNVYWIDPATGKPGGYIVPRTASQKTKNDSYADANESVVISR